MARIGVCCLPETGHLNPTLAVAADLAARGHDVVVFNVPDVEPSVRQAGLSFRAVATRGFPNGTTARRHQVLAPLSGVAAAVRSGQFNREYAEAILAELPEVIAGSGVDLLVIDQIDIAAHTVANHLDIPFVTIALCLIMNSDSYHPVWALEPAPDPPRLTPLNRWWASVFDYLYRPQLDAVRAYRARLGLPPLADVSDLWSTRAQISQQPEGFEFPLTLPACFHFAGPFVNPALRRPIDFPWDRLDGRPLIYAAFGSLVNGDLQRIDAVAEACSHLDVQLVLQADLASLRADTLALPGHPIVVPYAPQLELLARASLMITHAGLNSTLECLSAGVPMVAVPVTNDEPAIAARIAWSKTGVTVDARACDARRMRSAVETVLGDPQYRAGARQFQQSISQTSGVRRAGDIIERAL